MDFQQILIGTPFEEFGVIADTGIKLLVAAGLGGMVGYDREVRLKSAGLKTNILICMGAALYTAISLQNMTLVAGPVTGPPVDPNRVIAQVVSGVGFLGAGSIIQSRGSVTGMTTAATIWIVAALGAAIGSGQILASILFTLMVLGVLKLAYPVYALMNFSSKARSYHLEVLSVGEATRKVTGVVSDYQITEKPTMREIDKKRQKVLYTAEIFATLRQMKQLKDSLRKIVQIERVSYYESKLVKNNIFESDSESESDEERQVDSKKGAKKGSNSGQNAS